MCCIHCGAKLPEGTNFCIKCGAPVEKVESDGSEKKPTVVNQVDNSIDQMGEQIGQGIDDAAKGITSGLKKTGETI